MKELKLSVNLFNIIFLVFLLFQSFLTAIIIPNDSVGYLIKIILPIVTLLFLAVIMSFTFKSLKKKLKLQIVVDVYSFFVFIVLSVIYIFYAIVFEYPGFYINLVYLLAISILYLIVLILEFKTYNKIKKENKK